MKGYKVVFFTMNVHSCHLKVRGKGGKGKHNTQNSSLTSLVVYAVGYFYFFIYVKILLILNIALKGCFLLYLESQITGEIKATAEVPLWNN